jgi:hypothetical protein
VNAIYDRLPEEFRVSADPTELIRVWRGDTLGRHVTGMMCRLSSVESAEIQVREAAGAGVEGLNQLIDLHTDGDRISPLISVATAISLAQAYSTRENETIYEIEIPASRLLRDPYSIGNPRGNEAELFVIGAITPLDFRALKTNNHDRRASDLMYQREVRGKTLTFIASSISDYRHDPAKPRNPAGIWQPVRSKS